MRLITLKSPMTCVELESQLGLSRGQVVSIETKAGVAIATVADSVPLTDDEKETAALAQVDTIIDGITTIAGMKVFMKRLCARLVRNGVLP